MEAPVRWRWFRMNPHLAFQRQDPDIYWNIIRGQGQASNKRLSTGICDTG